MKQSVKVSVIVPCHDVAPYLRRCLDCLMGQTLKDIEIICIDDKSTDNTLQILQEYAKKDKRIKVIALKENKGVSVARNTGIDMAKGQYIGFVDSDDYIDLNFYEQLYNKAKETGADLVKSYATITENNITRDFNNSIFDKLCQKGKWYFSYQWWTGLYKAEIIHNHKIYFPIDIISGQDIVFLTKYIAVANKLVMCPNVFYHYMRRSDSLDQQILPANKILSRIKAIGIVCDIYNTVDMPNDTYLFLYANRWNELKNLILRSTNKTYKRMIVEELIRLYTICKTKNELIEQHITKRFGGVGYVKYLKSEDIDGLLNCFIKMPAHNVSIFQKMVYLFGIIPVAKINKIEIYTYIKLFGIRLVKIKKTPTEYRIYVLYIPIIKVKLK